MHDRQGAEKGEGTAIGLRHDGRSATTHVATHDGEHHHFCSAGCLAKFEADPDLHAASRPQPTHPRGPSGPARCIPRSSSPGSCPICGMALEPVMPTASDGPSEISRHAASLLGRPPSRPSVFALEMGGHLTRPPPICRPPDEQLGSRCCSRPPSFYGRSWPFFERAWLSIRNKSLNMFTLHCDGDGRY